jgi:hypothetical protein
MFAVLAGIVLVITAVILWLGNITVGHALAIFIGIIGIMFIGWWAAPTAWGRRA